MRLGDDPATYCGPDADTACQSVTHACPGEDVDNWIPIYSLNDFMDEVNDQILDDLTEYFISYIKIGE